MILLLFIFVVFHLLLLSECTVTLLTTKEEKEIKDAFDSFFMESNVESLFEAKAHLRKAIVEHAINVEYKNRRLELLQCNTNYSVNGIIGRNFGEAFSPYVNPAYKIDFNYYFDNYFANNERVTSCLYDGTERTIRLGYYTPLLFLVVKNRLDIVRQMVGAHLNPKLKLDIPHGNMPLVNARSIARKFYDPDQRRAMLEVLKIDPEKHDLTTVKRHLKGELSITVKEAVIANDISMVESALFLGNFGDKEDVNVIRWATMKDNYLMLEMLVMEGYAIPAENDRPRSDEMSTYYVRTMLNQEKGKERPISPRYDIFAIPFNQHSV